MRPCDRAWSDEEVALLVARYPTESNAALARELGRTRAAVIGKANYIGLKKSGAPGRTQFLVKHGRPASDGTYRSWAGMHARAGRAKCYEHVAVCERWREFGNFLADMGELPDGMTIDRIDSNKGYGPDNCRWATHKEQMRNRRNNVFITAFGETKLLVLWAEIFRVSPTQLRNRLASGWSPESALSGVKALEGMN